jgi:hypothetical protein
MLEALADPDQERHADMREWLGEKVDPFDFKPPPLRLCRTMKWVLLHRE